MKIGNFDTQQRPLLIAEIGNNHEGSLSVAKELVQQAAECGVSAVKFQTFRTEHYVSQDDAARFARLKSFELTIEQFAELSELARGLGLIFISTPFDLESARRLAPLVDAYKIASGDNNFLPLIRTVCKAEKPMIVSTGLAGIPQILQVRDFIRGEWAAIGCEAELAVLHCVTAYPVSASDANLLAIRTLASVLDCDVGYSDHTLGATACIVAASLGAKVIEKHFTLSKTYSDFRDHRLSADPAEMRTLVAAIAEVSLMLGNGEKTLRPSEAGLESAVRRTIVAGRNLPAGHVLALDDLTWIRPLRGLAPGEEARVLGRALKNPVCFGTPLMEEGLEPISKCE